MGGRCTGAPRLELSPLVHARILNSFLPTLLQQHPRVCFQDIVSCLVSGLLTIGPRFGGAIDDSARYFKAACDKHQPPAAFVEELKKKGVRVPGIGHRIKNKDNRDKRVELLQNYARQFFPSTRYLDYAVSVEEYTLQKSNNLVRRQSNGRR